MSKAVLLQLAALWLLLMGDAAAEVDFIFAPEAGHRFATLPESVPFPEGIAVDKASGDLFVSTADFTLRGKPNKILRFAKTGKLEAVRDVSLAPVLGLAFHDGYLYLANTEALLGQHSKIQRIKADFNADTALEDVAIVPSVGAPAERNVANIDKSVDIIRFGSQGVSLPNAITIHKKPTAEGIQTTLYFSDSFQGAIFKIDKLDTCSLPCPAITVSHDPLLATANHAFGIAANGIALSHDATQLYIANLGDDRILRLDLPSGDVEVFAQDIARPDGIAFDAHDNLWICSLTENEIVVLNNAARVIAKLGSFQGVNNKGEVLGLLGPASLVFNNNSVFVTNFVFPQIPAFVGAEDVTTFTIAEIPVPAALR